MAACGRSTRRACVGESPEWWWNPLSYVRSDRDALEVAEIFALSNRDRDARTDAFFGPAGRPPGRQLPAGRGVGEQVTDAGVPWLTDHTDSEPAGILREHGCELAAKAVLADIHAPEEQRGGVFGGAQGICSFMLNDPVMRWVTPAGPADRRPRFDPELFVASRDTLYSMSREGAGSAAALVTWLTVAIMDAAERHATASPHGRLATPLVAVLDEAANVVRWPDLPNRISHYGSKGILPIVLLQSWAQGVEVWGQHGWASSGARATSASTAAAPPTPSSCASSPNSSARCTCPKPLAATTQPTGPASKAAGRSTSTSSNTRCSTSPTSQRLPKGRIVLFATGARPVLAKRVPFWEMPYAQQVTESIDRYGPGQSPTADAAAPAPVAAPRIRGCGERDTTGRAGPPPRPRQSGAGADRGDRSGG